MDPALLIPEAMALPLSPIFLQALLMLTFVAHLLLMNVMLGGSCIALVNELRGGRLRDSGVRAIPHELSGILTVAVALTVNLGVAPLLFMQVLYGQFLYTSSVLMAWWWLALCPVLILAYYGLYIYKFRYDGLKGLRVLLLGFSVLLLLATGFVLTNNMTLMLTPERWTRYFDAPGGWLLNLGEPTLLPRYLHMVIGSLAVGGLFVALMASWREKRGSLSAAASQERMQHGMRWFTYATLCQIFAGPLYLVSLPRETMLSFMGSDMTNTLIFLAGLAGVALLLLFAFRRQLWATTWTLVVVVTLMAVMRHMVRSEYLKPYQDLASVPVAPQYGPLALFLVSLVIGLALVFWMVKQALAAGKANAQES